MSELRKEKISCPHCKHEGEFELWSSINADLNPELKEGIFNEKIWAWTCPSCGETTYIPWGTLYHDMTNKFMIFFSFDSDDINDIYESFELPTTFGVEKDYTIRSVYGLMNFKEKIIILQNELNDLAIEHMKYMISHIIRPEISEKGYHLYFERLDPDETAVSEHGSIYFFYNDEEAQQTMSVKFALDNYYEHCLAIKIDPRMDLDGNKCVDEGWIDKQLKLAK